MTSLTGCGERLDDPVRPILCVSKECNRASVAQKHSAGMGTPPALFTRLNRVNITPNQALSGACGQHPVPAAGTPAGSSAQRWLSAQGGAVKCIESLDVGQKRDADWPARDLDAGRLSAMLASLPALTSIYLTLRPDLHCRPPAAAVRAFLAEAALAIGRRSGLQTLHLSIILLGGLADQVPEALVRELASVHTLEKVTLSLMACARSDGFGWPATFSLAHLVAGLAGLPRLRALTLFVANVGMDAALPASVSRLAQLTSLRLREFHGLRCAPGWARLPALVCLDFHKCVFAGDGEAALPGMDALAALTSLCIWRCPRMRVLPASLWRLTQLRHLSHAADTGAGTGAPRSELPGAGLPLSAPCFASMLA